MRSKGIRCETHPILRPLQYRTANLIMHLWVRQVDLCVLLAVQGFDVCLEPRPVRFMEAPNMSTSPENRWRNLNGLDFLNSSKFRLFSKARLTLSGSQGPSGSSTAPSSVFAPPGASVPPFPSVCLSAHAASGDEEQSLPAFSSGGKLIAEAAH